MVPRGDQVDLAGAIADGLEVARSAPQRHGRRNAMATLSAALIASLRDAA